MHNVALTSLMSPVQEDDGHALTAMYAVDFTPTLVISGEMELGSASQNFTLPFLSPTRHFLSMLQQAFETMSTISVTDVRIGVCSEGSVAISLGFSNYEVPDTNQQSLTSPLSSCETLYTLQSPPLIGSIEWCLKQSDNLYAESFMRHLGLVYSDDASYVTSRVVVRDLIAQYLRVNLSLFHQVDGSGLSRRNLLAPRALIQTLLAISRDPVNGPLFEQCLPIAGVDGTLANRFVGTIAQGKLYAKTGSETGVNSLSGWTYPPALNPSGSPPHGIAFAILSDHAIANSSVIRSTIDLIALAFTSLQAIQASCDSPSPPPQSLAVDSSNLANRYREYTIGLAIVAGILLVVLIVAVIHYRERVRVLSFGTLQERLSHSTFV